MKRLQPLLVLIILVLVMLAVDSLFFHFIFPSKKQKLLQQMNSAVQEDLRMDPPSDNTLALSIFQQPNRNEFSVAVKSCLGIESSQFENFPDELINSVGLESKWIEVENYDLKSSSGNIFRIHVLQESPQKPRIVQFFNLDQQRVFAPVALESDLRLMPADQLISKLKEKGQVDFYQTKERWVLKNQQVLAVTFENKKVVEFQLFTNQKTFACENADCFCY